MIPPRPCAFCGQQADRRALCAQCAKLLPWNDCFCERCGQPMQAAQPAGVFCAACQAKTPDFALARAPFVYEFPIDAALKAIKFRRQLWYVPAFADLLLRALERDFSGIDALLPVPLHRWRQMRRGFNQAAELVLPLQRATALPVLRNVHRVRATKPQSGLVAAERRKNLAGAFAIQGSLACRRPLIVDDVITTGATCSQLAMTLKAAGAESVSVLAVARSAVKG